MVKSLILLVLCGCIAYVSCQIVVGGSSQITDLNSSILKDATAKAMKIWNNKNFGVDKLYRHTEVIDGTQQVVAGILYKINVKLGETKCTKQDVQNLKITEEDIEAKCPLSGKEVVCKMSIQYKPWVQEATLLESSSDKSTECNIPID